MTSDEIKAELDKLLNEYDHMIPEWAKTRATREKNSEMKKVSLNVAKSRSSAKTEAGKERDAYLSREFKDKLNELFTNDCLFYSLDMRKKSIEQRIDVYRSLLAHDRTMINQTI